MQTAKELYLEAIAYRDRMPMTLSTNGRYSEATSKRHMKKYFEMMKKPSDMGYVNAMKQIAHSYEWGVGCKKQYKKAVEMRQKIFEITLNLQEAHDYINIAPDKIHALYNDTYFMVNLVNLKTEPQVIFNEGDDVDRNFEIFDFHATFGEMFDNGAMWVIKKKHFSNFDMPFIAQLKRHDAKKLRTHFFTKVT